MRDKLEKVITDKIYVTEEDTRREATDKSDVEQVCMNENMKRFTRTHDTPPMILPLLHELGIRAEGPAVKDVLEGTYVPPWNVTCMPLNCYNILKCHKPP